jgi:hypothetical protein
MINKNASGIILGQTTGIIKSDGLGPSLGDEVTKKHKKRKRQKAKPFAKGLGGGSAIAFSPSSITGLLAWFKADAIVGLADGAACTSWADQSGNAKDLSESADGVGSPTYHTGVVNGKPVVRFSNAGKVLERNDAALRTATLSLFIVAKFRDTTATRGLFTIFNNGTNNGINIVWNGDLHANMGGGLAVIFKLTLDTNWHQYGLRSDAADDVWTARFDKAAGHYPTETAVVAFNAAAVFTLARFYENAATLGANVDIAEVILYNNKLSDTNRDLVENYLSTKYGI